MVVQNGEVIARYGDVGLKASVASVRKSLLNAIIGVHFDEENIDLDRTIGDLNIDDKQSLSEREKSATVRDLLMSRSGVYHPSAYDTARERPTRHSLGPGEHWFYNN